MTGETRSSFKIYMNDVGLLGALSELNPASVIAGNDIFTEFKGALTEQYVVQQMLAERDFSLYYYSTDKGAYEVDLLSVKRCSFFAIKFIPDH